MIRVLAVLVPLLLPAAAAAQTPPSFGQIGGPAGCLIAPDAFIDQHGCALAPGVEHTTQVALTPDGAQLAVMADDGVAILRRDPASGGMSFASCTTDDSSDGRWGAEGVCTDGDALAGATAIAFSPDGAFAYVAAAKSNAITWLARNPATGALTPAGCIKQTVRAGERCTGSNGLEGARAVAISPDGTHVYVAAVGSSAVTVFRRDATTGALTPQSCVSQSGSDGACARAPGLREATSLQVSGDGAHVYVLGGLAITTLAVAPTGDLAWKGCLITFSPPGGPCTEVPLLAEPLQATLTADGRNLFVLTDNDDLVSFSRDAATGALTLGDCFRENEGEPLDPDEPSGACRLSHWNDPGAFALSADGRFLFLGTTSQVALYRRGADGRLTELSCATDLQCLDVDDFGVAAAMVASADARSLYVATVDGGVLAFQLTVAITSAKASGNAVRVGLACPAARREGCSGRLTGARAARFALAAGTSRAVDVRLTKRQTARLRTQGRVAIALRARMRGVATTTRRVVIR